MKTPKEILLEGHQEMTPRLDQMREEVLAAELGKAARPQARRNILVTVPLTLWNELIWPSRKAWAGLAAVWVALAVVKLAEQKPEQSRGGLIDAQAIAAWAEQEKLLAQLLGDRAKLAEKAPSAETPPPTAPAKSAAFLAEPQTQLA